MNYQQLKKIEKLMSMSSRQFHPNLEEAFQKMLDTIGFLDKLDNTNRLDIINVLVGIGYIRWLQRRTFRRVGHFVEM